MKRCPQCGAEYDNHVEFCFVDGTELSQLATSAATPGLAPPPALRPQRSRVVPLVLLGVLLVVTTPLVVVGVIYVVSLQSSEGGGEPPPPVGAVEDDLEPRSKPQQLDPPEPSAALVRVDSIPPGAQVWEEETRLCDRTPCTIEQPEHAPAVRQLVLVMAGFTPTPAQLEKSATSLQVEMRTKSRRRSPGPPPREPDESTATSQDVPPAPEIIEER